MQLVNYFKTYSNHFQGSTSGVVGDRYWAANEICTTWDICTVWDMCTIWDTLNKGIYSRLLLSGTIRHNDRVWATFHQSQNHLQSSCSALFLVSVRFLAKLHYFVELLYLWIRIVMLLKMEVLLYYMVPKIIWMVTIRMWNPAKWVPQQIS